MDAIGTGGTPAYLSPARWLRCFKKNSCVSIEEGKGYDIWAAGLILYSLAFNASEPFSPEKIKSIFKNSSSDNLKENIETYFIDQLQSIPELKKPPADSYSALIKDLLTPDKYLSVPQVLLHPWFVKMEATSPQWIERARNGLCDLVKSMFREQRPVYNPEIAQQASYTTLSPQDLPHTNFTNFEGRKTLLNSLQERLLNPSIHPSTITVCEGIGGVGKTQLAIRMLHDAKIKDHFGLRLWFQGADRKEMLDIQHLYLASELDLVDKNADLGMALKSLHQYLNSYSAQCGKPWLAIYDNADDPALLKPYLADGGHILITTRNNEWLDAIHVDIFEPVEALALTKKLLFKVDPEAKTLCEELGYLPLGIAQACAYILHEKLSASEYLEKLRQVPKIFEEDKRLLGIKLPSTMMALWQVTFETLKKSSPEALSLLHALAYLAPDSIPEKVLTQSSSYAAIEAARHYALIQKNENGFSMHRLTQQILRSKENKEEQAHSIKKILKNLNEIYIKNASEAYQHAHNQQLLSHAITLDLHSETLKCDNQMLELLDVMRTWRMELKQLKLKNDIKETLDIMKKTLDDLYKIEALKATLLDVNNHGNALQTSGKQKKCSIQ